MGLLRGIKRIVIEKALDKKKKGKVFDLEKADNYVLPEGAEGATNNSHYFSMHKLDTKECLYFRLAKRGGDVSDELWLVYRDENGTVYMAEKDHIKKGDKIPAEIKCIEAGKAFTFSYDGTVIKATKGEKGYVPEGEPVHLKLSGTFTGQSECFEFSYHMSSKPMAIALSKEKLDEARMKELEENHQIHYEQGGIATAEIDLGGKKSVMSEFPTFRDHSFGKRDWNYFDRYVWLMGMLENGDFIHTSLIRYPCVSQLQAGFYMSPGKPTTSILKATSMDDLPVTGGVPEKFAFDVKYVNGENVHVECALDFTCPFYFSDDFNINEGVSDFTVNGIRGRGITEFGFNKDSSRWKRN